jgi:outer membrane protein OmpA-like peptidoglycan-associated protein
VARSSAWVFKIEDLEDGTFAITSTNRVRLGPPIKARLPNDFVALAAELAQVRGHTRKGWLPQTDSSPSPSSEEKRSASRLEDVAEAGEYLLKAFLKDSNRDYTEVFRHQVQQALADDASVDVTIDLTYAKSLQGLPFEMLFWSDSDQFLAASRNFGLRRRYELVTDRKTPDPIATPLHLLVVVSNPHTDPRMILDTAKELTFLRRAVALSRGVTGFQIKLELLETDATQPDRLPTLRNLQAMVRNFGPHILHYIGHGHFDQKGYLELQKDGPSREVDRVDSGSIREVLEDRRPWLVVLNSCEGAIARRDSDFGGMAQSILNGGVPFVVAMSRAITDEAAKSFSEEFYPALLGGSSLTRAMSNARKQIKLHIDRTGAPELFTPVLYSSVEGDMLPIVAKSAPDVAVEPPSSSLPTPMRRGWRMVGLGAGAFAMIAVLATLWLGSSVEMAFEPANMGPPPMQSSPLPSPRIDPGGGDPPPRYEGGEGGYAGNDTGPSDTTHRGSGAGGAPISICGDGSAAGPHGDCPPSRHPKPRARAAAPALSPTLTDPRFDIDPSLRAPRLPPFGTMPPLPGSSAGTSPTTDECLGLAGEVFFNAKSAAITRESATRLDSFIDQIERCPRLGVILEGHDDETNTRDDSLRIADERAKSVLRYLVDRGIPENAQSTISYGKERPVAVGSNEQAYELNRRVVLRTLELDSNSEAAKSMQIWSSYRWSLASLDARLANYNRLREGYAGDAVDHASLPAEIAERASILADARNLLAAERQRGAMTPDELRIARDLLAEQTLRLNVLIRELERKVPVRIDHQKAADALEISLKSLDDQRRRNAGTARHPLFNPAERAGNDRLIVEARELLVRERAHTLGTVAEFAAAGDNIYTMLNKIEWLVSIYEARTERLEREFQSITDALHRDERLYLEILVPYAHPTAEAMALCAGLRLRDHLLGEIRHDIYHLPRLVQGDTASICKTKMPDSSSASLDDPELKIAGVDHLVTRHRIAVRSVQRLLPATTQGAALNGAQIELRLRLRGFETLEFAPRQGAVVDELPKGAIELLRWHSASWRAAQVRAVAACRQEHQRERDDEVGETEVREFCENDVSAEPPVVVLEIPVWPGPRPEGQITQMQAQIDEMGRRLGAQEPKLRPGSDRPIDPHFCTVPWAASAFGEANSREGQAEVQVSIRPEGVDYFLDQCLPVSSAPLGGGR